MNKTLIALAVLVSGSSSALSATDEELKQQLVGRWSPTSTCDADLLIFNADGTFVSGDPNGDPDESLEGTYQIADGRLTGEAEGGTMPVVTLSFESGTLFFVDESGTRDRLVPCS